MFITVVNNPAQAGVAPVVLGTFRTPDATIFSWDVAIQKARTAVFFSSSSRAFSTRTVGYLAQSMYPPGIANQPPGPFNGLQERFSIPLLSGTAGSNPNLPNGITIFPGGFPLYRNGVLVGAIGVSGDGVDQDDLIAASGTDGFQPSPAIRADNFLYLGARLPYAKFPRDAELRPNLDPTTSLPHGFEYLATDLDAGAGLPDLGSQVTTGNGTTGTDPAGAASGGGSRAGFAAFPGCTRPRRLGQSLRGRRGDRHDSQDHFRWRGHAAGRVGRREPVRRMAPAPRHGSASRAECTRRPMAR